MYDLIKIILWFHMVISAACFVWAMPGWLIAALQSEVGRPFHKETMNLLLKITGVALSGVVSLVIYNKM